MNVCSLLRSTQHGRRLLCALFAKPVNSHRILTLTLRVGIHEPHFTRKCREMRRPRTHSGRRYQVLTQYCLALSQRSPDDVVLGVCVAAGILRSEKEPPSADGSSCCRETCRGPGGLVGGRRQVRARPGGGGTKNG